MCNVFRRPIIEQKMATELKIDLHKILSGPHVEGVLDTLATLGGFVPGIILGVLVLLFSPELIQIALKNVKSQLDFGIWFVLAILLVAAYLFGSCLLLFTSIFRFFLWKLGQFLYWLWICACRYLSETLLMGIFRKSKNQRFQRTVAYWVHVLQFFYMPHFDQRGTLRSLDTAVRRLLEVRYGIKEDQHRLDEAWVDVLALPPKQASRAGRWVTMLHATGWGIIVIARVRPFSNGNSLCELVGGFLIFMGIWIEFGIFLSFASLDRVLLMRLRGVLDAIAEEAKTVRTEPADGDLAGLDRR